MLTVYSKRPWVLALPAFTDSFESCCASAADAARTTSAPISLAKLPRFVFALRIARSLGPGYWAAVLT